MREVFANIAAEITSIKNKVDQFTAEDAASQPAPPAVSIDIASEEKAGGGQKSEIPGPSAPEETEWQKKCRMCGGRMDLQMNGEMWLCYSCAYEEPGTGDIQGKSEEKSPLANAPEPAAGRSASLSSNEPIQGSIKGSSPYKAPSIKRKACPACSGKMKWHETEKPGCAPSADTREGFKKSAATTPQIFLSADYAEDTDEAIQNKKPFIGKSQRTRRKMFASCLIHYLVYLRVRRAFTVRLFYFLSISVHPCPCPVFTV